MTTCYVRLWNKMSILCLYQYISVLIEMVLTPFMKRNYFNNPGKDGKFGIDLVASMLNKLQTIELANVSRLFTST